MKVIKSADVQFFAQNQVKSKKMKGHHVRRCPIFRPKSSEEQDEDHHARRMRRCPIFRPKSNEEQKKKRISRPRMPSFPTKI